VGNAGLHAAAGWDGYPNHNHSSDAFDPNKEEVYIP